MKELIFFVLGASAGVIAFLMAWVLLASRSWRIAFMARLPDPPRGQVASLSASLWLLPGVFGLGCVRNLLLAAHVHPWPVNGLLSVVMVLAAFHLARAAILLRRALGRASLG